jgi:hypothetical protein
LKVGREVGDAGVAALAGTGVMCRPGDLAAETAAILVIMGELA